MRAPSMLHHIAGSHDLIQLFDAGIPATAFITNDIQAEYNRLKTLGVVFRGEPANMGIITAVIFEDTCGNLINLVQPAL